MKDSKYNKWFWDNNLEEMIPAEDYDGYRSKKEVHYVMEDIPDYISPTSQYNVNENDHTPERNHGKLKLVSGRAQRREDLKRSDCHELAPGDREHTMKWKDRSQIDTHKKMEDKIRRSMNERGI
tara:strand:- start:4734 stop:5105 length:372 start_codon:yes stop_codon:yes gene_type:complete